VIMAGDGRWFGGGNIFHASRGECKLAEQMVCVAGEDERSAMSYRYCETGKLLQMKCCLE
ncbi:hypothetical protein A2U01_0107520, partial [Trifolium medium]|nr:hypothetical protein [Trifolium medium]